MLDNGQAQARAADLLGVALIHPVEPLKDPVRLSRRDANARVLDRQHHPVPLPGHRDGHMAILLVVFDGVVTEVKNNLRQELFRAVHPLAAPGQGDGNPPLPGRLSQAGHSPFTQGVEVNPLAALLPGRALVQMGEVQDILHQRDQALGLLVNLAGEAPHVLAFHHPLPDDLRIAGDGSQGGLELMGDVGGKVPAHPILLLILPFELLHLPADAGLAGGRAEGTGLGRDRPLGEPRPQHQAGGQGEQGFHRVGHGGFLLSDGFRGCLSLGIHRFLHYNRGAEREQAPPLQGIRL